MTLDLLKDNPKKLFAKYLLPSVSATFVTSIYIIVDTMMIGRGVGANALVALNLVIPIFSILFAIGMLFGVGGGVLVSIAHGAKDENGACTAFSTAFLSMLTVAAIALLLCSAFLQPLCYFLGATPENLAMMLEYGAYIAHFAPVFIFSTFFQAIVRNDREPSRAMVAVLSGAVANIVLDYLFIFIMNMGMTGGAVATVLGNALTVLILLTHFLSPHNTMKLRLRQFSGPMLLRIISSGAPSSLIEGATGIVTLSFNRQLIKYLGEIAIIIYGIVTNCGIVCISLFNGIAQAAQPLLAANFGAKLYHRVMAFRRTGLFFAFVLGLLLASTAWWMPNILISLFVEPTPALFTQGIPVLRLYFIAFIPMGLNLFCGTYFQSVMRPAQALTIMTLRGVFLPLLFVFLLPPLFGGSIIWCVMPLNELLVLALGFMLMRRNPLPLHEE